MKLYKIIQFIFLSLLFTTILSSCYFYIPFETFSPHLQAFSLNDEVKVFLQFEADSQFGGWPNKRAAPYTIYLSVQNPLSIKVRNTKDYQFVIVHSLVVTEKLQGKQFNLVQNQKIPFRHYSYQKVMAKFLSEHKVFKTPSFSPKFTKEQRLTLNLDISLITTSATVRKQIEANYKAISGVKSGYMY